MLQAIRILRHSIPDYSFQIIRPTTLDQSLYQQYENETKIVTHSYAAIAESEFIIACSGTATVEVALLEVPYIIIYKVNALTWLIIKRLVRTRFAGMINILNDSEVVCELLQDKATPEAIAQVTLSHLTDHNRYHALKQKLATTKEMLSPSQASKHFADYIATALDPA